ncbi:hypothetical protein EYC84_005671 [Monilinia fructicola]|uniref:Uncharacterized protein n=1 Tax=Monilinia fructicola TaxID=38448 RepID=A0A5M9K1Z8_MONFR|nr:hypothetical protein EYC84_005671 [Monilinia fructicola]
MSPASLRGASLSTLPLEAGALAMAAYANNTIGRIIAPATSAAERVAKPFMPSAAKKDAAMALCGKSGTEDAVRSTVANGNIQYKGVRSASYNLARSGDGEPGPCPPYPICFVARSDIERRDGDGASMPQHEVGGHGRACIPSTPRALLCLGTPAAGDMAKERRWPALVSSGDIVFTRAGFRAAESNGVPREPKNLPDPRHIRRFRGSVICGRGSRGQNHGVSSAGCVGGLELRFG